MNYFRAAWRRFCYVAYFYLHGDSVMRPAVVATRDRLILVFTDKWWKIRCPKREYQSLKKELYLEQINIRCGGECFIEC